MTTALRRCSSVASSVLAALNMAAERTATFGPDRDVVTSLLIPHDELSREVSLRRTSAGGASSSSALRELLAHEPATWSGLVNGSSGPSDGWSWDPTATGLQLRRFAQVSDAEDYLNRLDAYVVGVADQTSPPPMLPPLALLDALDHLDAEWKIRTKDRLFLHPRLASAGNLTQPVNSAAEFESACAAFADLLNQIDPRSSSKPNGALNQLESRLRELRGERAGRATAAVQTLRQIVHIRVGQQHSGVHPYTQEQAARNALGLPAISSDWQDDWNRVRAAAVDSLRVLREEITTPDEDEV